MGIILGGLGGILFILIGIGGLGPKNGLGILGKCKGLNISLANVGW